MQTRESFIMFRGNSEVENEAKPKSKWIHAVMRCGKLAYIE